MSGEVFGEDWRAGDEWRAKNINPMTGEVWAHLRPDEQAVTDESATDGEAEVAGDNTPANPLSYELPDSVRPPRSEGIDDEKNIRMSA